jgi:nicotinate-nucleotide pyrophosphorylase (carboxylating)
MTVPSQGNDASTAAAPGEADSLIRAALAEDVGEGDWTTLWTVPEEARAAARILAKSNGVVAGLEVVRRVFEIVDPSLTVELLKSDGDPVRPAEPVVRLQGSARSILTAERVALNFLQQLSGVATTTRAYVDAVAGTGARILDTRKTTPGMRTLEKAAVRAGGGSNHRYGLHDMVLIKENHIAAAGGIGRAVAAVRRENGRGLAIEVEATNLAEVEQAIRAGVDRVLFDNMPLPMLTEAISQVRQSGLGMETEASGGITLATVRPVAETGVDFVSVGALTHSPPALDLSLLIDR